MVSMLDACAERDESEYEVWSYKELPTQFWSSEGTVPSQGNTTTWTDPAKPVRMKSYRIGLEF